ncbi:MAG: hypothetical protein ACRBFS_02235 [Aureispira sp.]
MKITVKNPRLLGKMALSAYHTKLKASFVELEAAQEKGAETTPYFFRSEHSFQDGKIGPLLVIGMNNAWKEHIKAEKWAKSPENKKTAIGHLRSEDLQLSLVLEQGSITNNNFQKAIKNSTVLKKYTWTLVEKLEDQEDVLEEDKNEDNSIETALKQLLDSFQKREKIFKTLSAAIKKTTGKEQRQYLLKRRKVLKRLKVNTREWTELSQEANATLQATPIYQDNLQQYQQWTALFAKMEAAKTQESADPESLELEEEQLYAKTLNDVQNFNSSLKGVKEVDTIEEAVAKLGKHIQQWESMTNQGQKGKLAANFQVLQEQSATIQEGWNILKPILSQWHDYKEQIEALQDKGETPSEALINNFLNSNERLQTAL